MKACFVIAIIFACMFCEITSLKCYSCYSEDVKSFAKNNSLENVEDVPNCASQTWVECREEFCFKSEYGAILSKYYSEPAGHYFGKGCGSKDLCTSSGTFWNWGTWVTC